MGSKEFFGWVIRNSSEARNLQVGAKESTEGVGSMKNYLDLIQITDLKGIKSIYSLKR